MLTWDYVVLTLEIIAIAASVAIARSWRSTVEIDSTNTKAESVEKEVVSSEIAVMGSLPNLTLLDYIDQRFESLASLESSCKTGPRVLAVVEETVILA